MSDKTSNNGQAETEIAKSGLPFAMYLWAAVIAAVVGFAAVYVTTMLSGNALQEAQAPAAQKNASKTPKAAVPTATKKAGSGRNPLSTGEMATFVFKKTPKPLPTVSFKDPAGADVSLEKWRGKLILLNVWATWCAPCRKEMPTLDELQGELGSDKFEVLAISVDRKGSAAAKKFLDKIKVAHLPAYADPSTDISKKLNVFGMPTTLLIDAKGREIGRLVGPAEWNSEDAKRLIRAQLP